MKRSGFLRVSPDASRLTVRLKRCKVKTCRAQFVPSAPFVTWCSPDCGSVLGLEKITKAKVREAKAAERAAKAERKADKVKRQSLKTRADWIKEAQTAFNAYIRERDKDKPCICCGRGSGMDTGINGHAWDCGHYRSTGSAPHLRFHEDNAHRQLVLCNRYGAGRAVDYRIGLIRRIGLEAVEEIERDQSQRKWSIDDLREIKQRYAKKLKELRAKHADM